MFNKSNNLSASGKPYRLLRASDDSFLRIAIISLNNIEWQAPFDSFFPVITSRHVILSEFKPPVPKNLSSRNLAMHVSATCKNFKTKQIIAYIKKGGPP